MSVIDTKRPVPLGAATAFRLVGLVERALEAISAWRRARATENALAELSDRQLADIGLHRGDIADLAETLATR